MTHRTRVFSLNQDLTIREALPRIIEEGYSRIPLFEDNPEEISGILLSKDIMRFLGKDEDKKLKELMIPPLFIPQSKRINEVFQRIKGERLNLAVVMDEYGGLSGIITIEDIVEEILGEFYDEDEETGVERIVKLENGSYRIQAEAPIHVLTDHFDINVDVDAHSIGGLIGEILDRMPQKNDSIRLPGGHELIVEAVIGNRIETVILVKHESEEYSDTYTGD